MQREDKGGSHLSKRDARVWILDGWDASIGVEADVGLFLEVFEFPEDGLVGQVQLLEENGDFPRVGALYLEGLGSVLWCSPALVAGHG